ncbi:MAG: M48 family metallopeptidase [bacterium]|nr:M48 family metallopeptidase [bacterium]
MTATQYNPKEAFKGRLRGKSISGDSCPAHIAVDRGGIHARPDGEEMQTLAFKGMRLRRDESGALIATSKDGSSSVTCLDPAFERALETMAGNDLNEQLTRLSGQKTSSRSKHLFGCALVLIALGAFLWSVPTLFDGTITASVDALPMEVDEALGEAAQESMDAGGSIVEDEAVNEAIQAILDRLTPHATVEGLQYQFRVVRNDEANAYALPGGYITVFTGLITQSDHPDQVAGVLAHEMAHAKLRHGLLRVAHNGAFAAGMAILFGSLDGLESVAVELFALQQVNDYSQDAETEADLEGVRILIAAGISPQGLIDSFSRMQDRYGDMPKGMAWASSHPQFDERIQSIEEAMNAQELPDKWDPVDLDWDAVLTTLED